METAVPFGESIFLLVLNVADATPDPNVEPQHVNETSQSDYAIHSCLTLRGLAA